MKQLRTSTEDGSTLRIELDCKSADIEYTTAETFAIFPINDNTLIERLASSQDWDLDRKFILKYKVPISYPFPSILTVREALTKFCDITTLLSYFILYST